MELSPANASLPAVSAMTLHVDGRPFVAFPHHIHKCPAFLAKHLSMWVRMCVWVSARLGVNKGVGEGR